MKRYTISITIRCDNKVMIDTDINNITYTSQIMKESLKLYNTIVIERVMRSANKDDITDYKKKGK